MRSIVRTAPRLMICLFIYPIRTASPAFDRTVIKNSGIR